MRRVRSAVAVVLSLAALSVFAGTFSTGPAQKTFMWKVERGRTTVYLVGSIHALREDAYPLPSQIETAFAGVELAVFEIDVDDMNAAALKMMIAGSLAEGETLEQVVGPETWSAFEAHVEELGYDASLYRGMRPWMAALTLAAFELAEHGYLATAGLDSYLSRRADETGKDRLALETADFQVSLFADLTADQSLAFLQYTLEDLSLMIPEMESLYRDWRTGNVESLETLLLQGFEEFPELFDTMVARRNRTWLPQIEEILAGDRDAMVVVGSAHLVGEHGLVKLLRDKGYAVEQL